MVYAHTYYYWIYIGGDIMQVKQTFPKSYPDDKERQEAIKKIYRQLHMKFQYELEEAKDKDKTDKRAS